MTLVFIFLFFLSGCGNQKLEGEFAWSLEDFEFTNQHDEMVSKADLQGQVWLANFIFTNCETICPPMTANMSRIQAALAENGLDEVKIVSFSVDPEIDTPEILTEFAANFTDNTDNWHFLTGYAQTYIEQFAYENFHEHVLKPDGDDQVLHGTSFYLVDKTGTIVKDYEGVSNVPYDEIINDVKILDKRN